MEARLIDRFTRNHFISVVANEVELLSIWAQVWARFSSDLQGRVGDGVGWGGQEKWWSWIQPKITLSYFETILRQNLLFSVAVLISMLDVSCDSVSSYIYLNLRRNIKQDNLIISNNEKKACKKTGDFGRNWASVGWCDDEIWPRSSHLCANKAFKNFENAACF